MITIQSKQHREIVGSVNGAPYTISFDANGLAEVEYDVAKQLTTGSYGVVLIDEDGAETSFAELEAKEEAARLAAEEAKKTKKQKAGSDVE